MVSDEKLKGTASYGMYFSVEKKSDQMRSLTKVESVDTKTRL